MAEVMVRVVKQEGFKALWKGGWPSVLKVGSKLYILSFIGHLLGTFLGSPRQAGAGSHDVQDAVALGRSGLSMTPRTPWRPPDLDLYHNLREVGGQS